MKPVIYICLVILLIGLFWLWRRTLHAIAERSRIFEVQMDKKRLAVELLALEQARSEVTAYIRNGEVEAVLCSPDSPAHPHLEHFDSLRALSGECLISRSAISMAPEITVDGVPWLCLGRDSEHTYIYGDTESKRVLVYADDEEPKHAIENRFTSLWHYLCFTLRRVED